MPKRRSIKTSNPSNFEPKRKNPIQLGSDSNIDNDLKPLKIGGKTTPLKISNDTIEVGSTLLYNGSEVLSGSIEGTELISTGEGGGSKFLREDGDGTCSWQTVSVSGNFITDNADDTMAGTLTIDKNSTATTSGVTKGLSIDYDHTGITASGQSINNVGLDINITDSSPTHIGTHTNYGIKMSTTSNTSGAGTVYGIQNTATGGDTNIGYMSTVTNGGNDFILYDSADGANYSSIATGADGATTITTVDDSGSAGHLTLDPDGDLIVSGADVKIDSEKKLYLDGGTDTYIYNGAADRIDIVAGADTVVIFQEDATGNKADFGTTGVGFTQFEPTYNASDTNVNFNDYGNKAFVTFGSGNITDMNLYFPNVSCNCTLLLKQDGSGSRTVTNWKTFDQADGNESTVVWAGGSAPTLTTTANKLDIISFYWDNDNHKAYGVASLNF
tara:strand:- start:57 stop:1385 length:1329 start_codon:yes stop_codon:yes gene_type:complete